MAFEPKTWTCGETITADELNRMEQGIAESGGAEPFVFTLSVDTSDFSWASDKTYSQISDAMASGSVVVARIVDMYGDVTMATRIYQSAQAQSIIVDDIFAFITQDDTIPRGGNYNRYTIKSDNSVKTDTIGIYWAVSN